MEQSQLLRHTVRRRWTQSQTPTTSGTLFTDPSHSAQLTRSLSLPRPRIRHTVTTPTIMTRAAITTVTMSRPGTGPSVAEPRLILTTHRRRRQVSRHPQNLRRRHALRSNQHPPCGVAATTGSSPARSRSSTPQPRPLRLPQRHPVPLLPTYYHAIPQPPHSRFGRRPSSI